MDKAILIIDMPENCTKCPLHEISYDFHKHLCVPAQKLHDKFATQKPDWCPLQTLSDEKG